jgi:hypothetical protein
VKQPVSIYINWAAYDELSNNVELTETLAMRQLDELIRLRGLGIRFDYYLMDAFWYAPDGAYRTWRKPHWPDGPDRWLERCSAVGVKPGLWVTANTLRLGKMTCPPAWRDSLDEEAQALCCFYGGFLADFVQALHEWYERGVRLFKFDFADFQAAPRALRDVMTPTEVRAANVTAWQGALKAFRRGHPEVLVFNRTDKAVTGITVRVNAAALGLKLPAGSALTATAVNGWLGGDGKRGGIVPDLSMSWQPNGATVTLILSIAAQDYRTILIEAKPQ